MYQNILVINLMHIGDLMLVTPVLRTLRTNYPKAKITLLADKKLRDLVEHNRRIDGCMLLDKKGADDRFGSFLRYIRKVRARHFDLVINLHRNERASALAAFSGARRIVGYAKPGFSLFFDMVLPNKKAVMHQIHSHFEVLEASGIVAKDKIDDGGLELWLADAAKSEAARIWKAHFAEGEKVIAFHIGASWKTKRWLDCYFAACADRLIRRGYAVAFFGGPMDEALVAACIQKMQEKASAKLHVFTGKVSLAVLAGMLRRCSLFLTTDSGPMHVGVAMNVPIVTMFGASPVPGFYPYDAKDVLIKTPAPCHPCGLHECPKTGKENMACMKNIPVGVVMQYVEELLERYDGAPAYQLPAHYGAYECRVIEL